MLAGFACGVVAGALLDGYFNWGPEAGSPDAGEAHGILLLLIGFPLTSLVPAVDAFSPVISRTLFVLATGVSWGLLWAAISLLRARWWPDRDPGRTRGTG